MNTLTQALNLTTRPSNQSPAPLVRMGTANSRASLSPKIESQAAPIHTSPSGLPSSPQSAKMTPEGIGGWFRVRRAVYAHTRVCVHMYVCMDI